MSELNRGQHDVLPTWDDAGSRLRRLIPARTVSIPKVRPERPAKAPKPPKPPKEPRPLARDDESRWRVQAFAVENGTEFAYEPRQVRGEWLARIEAKELLAGFPKGTARVECAPWADHMATSGNAARFGIH